MSFLLLLSEVLCHSTRRFSESEELFIDNFSFSLDVFGMKANNKIIDDVEMHILESSTQILDT